MTSVVWYHSCLYLNCMALKRSANPNEADRKILSQLKDVIICAVFLVTYAKNIPLMISYYLYISNTYGLNIPIDWKQVRIWWKFLVLYKLINENLRVRMLVFLTIYQKQIILPDKKWELEKWVKITSLVTKTQVRLPIAQKARTQEMSFDWKGIWALFRRLPAWGRRRTLV